MSLNNVRMGLISVRMALISVRNGTSGGSHLAESRGGTWDRRGFSSTRVAVVVALTFIIIGPGKPLSV